MIGERKAANSTLGQEIFRQIVLIRDFCFLRMDLFKKLNRAFKRVVLNITISLNILTKYICVGGI